MKTIIEKSTNISVYLFDDAEVVNINEQNIVTLTFNIADMNLSNAILVENVIAPDDWFGRKYMFENNVWTMVENWVQPI